MQNSDWFKCAQTCAITSTNWSRVPYTYLVATRRIASSSGYKPLKPRLILGGLGRGYKAEGLQLEVSVCGCVPNKHLGQVINNGKGNSTLSWLDWLCIHVGGINQCNKYVYKTCITLQSLCMDLLG